METNAQIKAVKTSNGGAYCVAGVVALAIGWFVAFAGICGPLAIFLGIQAYRKGVKEGGGAIISLGLLLTLKVAFFLLNNLAIAKILSEITSH